MKRDSRRTWGLSTVLLLTLLLTVTPVRGAATVDQVIRLDPGWNSVFLEVQPEPSDPAAVFAGIPVESLWYWSPVPTPVQFVRDPGEQLLDQPGWHVWFPVSSGDKARLTNLYAVRANRPFLVQLGGDAPVTLTVTGRPSLARAGWIPDSFNFTGFTLDPSTPPSFGSFFASSPAHAGQAIFRLSGGVWQRVLNTSESMRPGEAFWIYTKGGSSYRGPMQVELEGGDELDFGSATPERSLRIRNLAGASRGVALAVRGGDAIPLARKSIDEGGMTRWPHLGDASTVTVPPGLEESVTLALRRSEMGDGRSEGVLEITDGAGSRVLVPLAGAVTLGAAGEVDHAGLWVGTATVKAVTEVQIPGRDEFTIPQPTGFWFTFRLILHVDADGKARLVKEVIHMRSRATETEPARPVLITDESLASSYNPVALVGGEPFSHRISTAAYDFSGFSQAMTGTVATGGTLNCTIAVPSTLATNPFRHGAHPDHDNVDALDRPITDPRIQEVYGVTRALTLRYGAEDPECLAADGCTTAPDWNVSRMGGSYEETLTGLHRNPITVAGIFTLRRVTDIAELIPGGVTP